jgi:large subunit ribosomal protein L10
VGRPEKATRIEELRQQLSSARGVVLTDYRGLSVAELTDLRRLLRKSAVEYRVVKNSLARLAIRETGLAGLAPYLEGPTAMAISRTEPVAASRALLAWGKTRPTFALKGGVVEGHVVGPADIGALADLPPREILLARMAGAFQAPLQGLARVLAGPISALAVAVNQVRQQREHSGATAPDPVTAGAG